MHHQWDVIGLLKSDSTLKTSVTGESLKKICTVCEKQKPLTAFRKYSGRSPDGKRPLCANCQRAYEMEWRANNKDRLTIARANRKGQTEAYAVRYNEENWARYMTTRIRTRCQKMGIPYDLDDHLDELNERYNAGQCEMTGLPFRTTLKGRRAWDSASLDRINPTDGYVYSNIRVVCFGMNAALGDWGEAVFTRIANAYLQRMT